jgi:hypothetical protein
MCFVDQRRVRMAVSVRFNCDSSVTSPVSFEDAGTNGFTNDHIHTIYATIAINSCIINVIAIFHVEINNKIGMMAQMADRYYFVLPILLVQRQIHYPSPHLLHRTTLTTATIRTTATTGMGVSPIRCTNGIVSGIVVIKKYLYVVRRRTTTTLYQCHGSSS